MKKIGLALLSVTMLLGLAACDNTPEGILGDAGKALQENNFTAFTRTLTGDALAQYGNSEGMQALRRELRGQDLSVSRTDLTFRDRCGNRCVRRVYAVQVVGKSSANGRTERIKNAEVICKSIESIDPKTRASSYNTKCRISQFNLGHSGTIPFGT